MHIHRLTGMQSPDSEMLLFNASASDSSLTTGSPLEAWLASSEYHMRKELASACETALEAAHPWAESGDLSARGDWVASHGAQSVLAASHAVWTNAVETALATTD